MYASPCEIADSYRSGGTFMSNGNECIQYEIRVDYHFLSPNKKSKKLVLTKIFHSKYGKIFVSILCPQKLKIRGYRCKIKIQRKWQYNKV